MKEIGLGIYVMDTGSKNGLMVQNMRVNGLTIKYDDYKQVHGRGIFYHVDGDVYIGDFENDKMHG